MILSGAKIPGVGFTFPARNPPLLATQGTADTINPPSLTHAFYDPAPRPKFLLTLLGATHLPPYTFEQPQLGIVERVSIGFLDHYCSMRAARSGGWPEPAMFTGSRCWPRIHSPHFNMPVALTVKPPWAAVALTPVIATCGLVNTVTVARPPNGTFGATTSAPFTGRDRRVDARGDAEQRRRPAQRRAARYRTPPA